LQSFLPVISLSISSSLSPQYFLVDYSIINNLKDVEGWEEVQRKRGKAVVNSKIGGKSQFAEHGLGDLVGFLPDLDQHRGISSLLIPDLEDSL